ncbi:hypothetical protein CQ018_18115 [Arthrobacter sp. MYb227]|nr:hypothetical protein CQ018_18115 [Arthrobacter sp. MYb227]
MPASDYSLATSGIGGTGQFFAGPFELAGTGVGVGLGLGCTLGVADDGCVLCTEAVDSAGSVEVVQPVTLTKQVVIAATVTRFLILANMIAFVSAGSRLNDILDPSLARWESYPQPKAKS